MSSSQLRQVADSIAERVADYRRGEIETIDRNHVLGWVSQFDEEDQPLILEETGHLLKRCYLSKRRVLKRLRELLFSEEIHGADPEAALQQTQFLKIWRKGKSQEDLLSLAGEILHEKGIDIETCGREHPKAYIYLDDSLYSGNTAVYDFKKSGFFDQAETGAPLRLLFLATHRVGVLYAHEKLRAMGRPRKIAVDVWSTQQFYNRRATGEERFDCYWPPALEGDEYVDAYVAGLKAEWETWFGPMFRPAGVPKVDEMFSSPGSRKTLEGALLKAGAQIVTWPANAKAEMRPMGYEKLRSLGFGSPVVTYRNISNNCPLALWWGDPSMPSNHPFSKWRPLFPRKGNEPSVTAWL